MIIVKQYALHEMYYVHGATETFEHNCTFIISQLFHSHHTASYSLYILVIVHVATFAKINIKYCYVRRGKKSWKSMPKLAGIELLHKLGYCN